MVGKLIVFEGVEGAGKTTQIQATAKWLQSRSGNSRFGGAEATHTAGRPQGLTVIITREPGGSEVGKSIRRLLLENTDSNVTNRTELLLYAADRAQHIEEVIQPHLDRGNIVLCDRFTDSTIAYQGYGRGIDRELIDRVNELATGGVQSDLTLWLDLDVRIGLERVSQRGQRDAASRRAAPLLDRIEKATLDFHQRVQQGYQDLAKAYPDRIIRIDAQREETDVQAEIRSVLAERLSDVAR